MVQFQRKDYWCGVASVQAALRALGVKHPQQYIAGLADVNPAEGMDEIEVKRALLACGRGVDEMETTSESAAESWLLHHIEQYGPAIICLDEWEHWCVVIGTCKDRFVVFDPSNSPDNRAELGIHFYAWNGLRTRWLLPKREGGPSFYAIGVG